MDAYVIQRHGNTQVKHVAYINKQKKKLVSGNCPFAYHVLHQDKKFFMLS